MIIGMAHVEQIFAFQFTWATKKNDNLEIDWKKSKSNQNNSFRHYFILKLPKAFQFII